MSLDQEKVKRIIEGALFAAGQPMKLDKIASLFTEDERPTTDVLMDALQAIKTDFAERGVMLKEVASGYRFQVQEDVGEWVSRLWEEKPPRYSRALLETLALIAYRQPITRGEIEEIRGVSVSSHITKTLLERDWVRVVGHRDVPGRPAMYGTTRVFLDYFNLKNLDELPSLAEIRDLDTINAELELEEQGGVPQAAAENLMDETSESEELDASHYDDLESDAVEPEPREEVLESEGEPLDEPPVEQDQQDAPQEAVLETADENEESDLNSST